MFEHSNNVHIINGCRTDMLTTFLVCFSYPSVSSLFHHGNNSGGANSIEVESWLSECESTIETSGILQSSSRGSLQNAVTCPGSIQRNLRVAMSSQLTLQQS